MTIPQMAGAMPGWKAQHTRPRWAALTCCCVGVAVVSSPAQQPAATCSVQGLVENRLTHKPIARALVEMGGGNGDSVLTDSNGHFELNLPEGNYALTARRPGYSQRQNPGNRITVSADITAPTLYLTPQATVTGHVTLSGGEAADGFRFFVYRKRSEQGHVRWEQSGMATTDSAGDFRFLELQAPGTYIFCNNPSPDDGRLMTHGYASTCFPGGADFATSAAGPLTLTPGQQAELDVALTRQKFYRVSITSNLSQGQGAQVEIHGQTGPQAGEGEHVSRRPGDEEIELPNGNYYAEVRTYGHPASYGRIDFKVADAPRPGLTVTALPLQPLRAEIRKDFTAGSDSGQGIETVSGNENGGFSNINLNLIPADNLFENPFGGNLRRPDGASDGDVYEMDGVTPGRYWVQAMTPEGYVSSMTSGQTDLMQEPLTIGAGESGAPIEITLRNDTGTIACTVNAPSSLIPDRGASNGETQPVSIYVIPQSGSMFEFRETIGVPGGDTDFPGLAPGTYTLAAFDGYYQIDNADPDELARVIAKGQSVTVAAGSTAQVELDPIPNPEENASQ